MNFWNETPLFRFLLIFICGILFAAGFPLPGLVAGALLCSMMLMVLIGWFFFRRKLAVYKVRWMAGAVGYTIVFFSGAAITWLHAEKNHPQHFRNAEQATGFIGYLDEPMKQNEKSYKTVLKILYVLRDGKRHPASGKCLAHFLKDSTSAELNYGEQILFSKKPTEVLPAANPSQFDYKKWLGYKNIYDQVFIRPGEWISLGGRSGFSLPALSYSLRDKLLKVFSENHITGQDYGVLSALILGYEDDIGSETMSAYAASGALHVLSVSGLHVGIIYIAINFLLGFLDHNRRTRRIKAVIIILFLWFYALLTGWSPSVLRSATMLTFIVIGSTRQQQTSLYNTLSASALFLLCLDPYLLMQVGFQLSYAAVLGIIALQPSIKSWHEPRTWLLKQLWSITSVSLAAQAATFPLGLMYFHQFPVYFLIANILVIPVSTFIIYGGILLLAISWWHAVAGITGMLLGSLVHVMNEMVLFIERLPFSLILGVSITVLETCIIYAIMGSMIAFFTFRNPKYLVAAFLAGVLFLASQVIESIRITGQKQMVIYNIRGKSVLNIISGRENYLLADTVLTGNGSAMLYAIYPYWWDCGLNEKSVRMILDSVPQRLPYCRYRNFLLFENLRIAEVRDAGMLAGAPVKKEVDFLLLSGNVRTDLKAVLQRFTCRQLIIDSSNSIFRAARWLEEAAELKVKVHSVPHHGAFVYSFAGDKL